MKDHATIYCPNNLFLMLKNTGYVCAIGAHSLQTWNLIINIYCQILFWLINIIYKSTNWLLLLLLFLIVKIEFYWLKGLQNTLLEYTRPKYYKPTPLAYGVNNRIIVKGKHYKQKAGHVASSVACHGSARSLFQHW